MCYCDEFDIPTEAERKYSTNEEYTFIFDSKFC